MGVGILLNLQTLPNFNSGSGSDSAESFDSVQDSTIPDSDSCSGSDSGSDSDSDSGSDP